MDVICGSGEIEGAWTAGTGTFHDMQVNHGGLDAGVTHQGLDGADVGSGFEEMGGPASLRYAGASSG